MKFLLSNRSWVMCVAYFNTLVRTGIMVFQRFEYSALFHSRLDLKWWWEVHSIYHCPSPRNISARGDRKLYIYYAWLYFPWDWEQRNRVLKLVHYILSWDWYHKWILPVLGGLFFIYVSLILGMQHGQRCNSSCIYSIFTCVFIAFNIFITLNIYLADFIGDNACLIEMKSRIL